MRDSDLWVWLAWRPGLDVTFSDYEWDGCAAGSKQRGSEWFSCTLGS